MKNISKNKWQRIKIMGKNFVVLHPDNTVNEYVLYYRKFFNKKEWDDFYKKEKSKNRSINEI